MHVTSGNHSPEYSRYLKSKTWKSLAARIRKRDHYRCRACNKKPYRKRWFEFWRAKDWLTVHHMSYVEWERAPGSEPESVLITLCRAHHDEVHARHRAGHFGAHDGSLRSATMYVVDRCQAKVARQAAKRSRKLAKT
jgi:hypothetical protein